MVSITKIVAVTAAVFAATASAAKCTAKQLKEIEDITPDTESCTKYWSATVKSPSKEALCKDETCEASIRRMTALFPDCTNEDGKSTKALFESDLKYCDSIATKCTAAEIKKLTDATPDKETCTKYYSTKEPPSTDVFCKDTACVASVKRLVLILPDCINDNRRVKKEILSDIAVCEKKASNSTSTPKPSSTTSTPKPTAVSTTPSTKTPSTKAPSSDVSTSTTTTSAPAATTAAATSAPTPAPTKSAAFAPSQASSVLLGSSLVAAVYMVAN